jgi:hypothetical protein
MQMATTGSESKSGTAPPAMQSSVNGVSNRSGDQRQMADSIGPHYSDSLPVQSKDGLGSTSSGAAATRPAIFRKNRISLASLASKRLSKASVDGATGGVSISAEHRIPPSQRRPMWRRMAKTNGENGWTAIYDYEAQNDDELTLKCGTDVQVNQ